MLSPIEYKYEFNMMYCDRRRWIKRRNKIERLLRIFGVSLFVSCDYANRIMEKFWDTPKIVK